MGQLGVGLANDSLNINKFCDEELNLRLPNRSQILKTWPKSITDGQTPVDGTR